MAIREAIVEALEAAGVDGLCSDDLDDYLAERFGDDAVDLTNSDEIDALQRDGIVEIIGCSWFRLTRAEWSRRVAGLLGECGVVTGALGVEAVAGVLMAALMPGDKE